MKKDEKKELNLEIIGKKSNFKNQKFLKMKFHQDIFSKEKW